MVNYSRLPILVPGFLLYRAKLHILILCLFLYPLHEHLQMDFGILHGAAEKPDGFQNEITQ